MKISASIYSSDNGNLTDLVKELDDHSIDYFHVDCKDDLSVFDDIKAMKAVSATPIDLHIITATPEKFYDGIRETGTEMVTFQFEDLTAPLDIPEDINCKLGLAIVSETPISVFAAYADRFNFILFMATVPGESGGRFEKSNFRKIREFRNTYPDKRIHVDGGVDDEISFILRNMGVFSAFSGSFLLKNTSIGAAMLNLKSDDMGSHYHVQDFMLDLDEIPPVEYNEALNFLQVLENIEKNKLGFTIAQEPGGKMAGIITMADIRRALIRNMGSIDQMKVSELLNTNPVQVSGDSTVAELLRLIKNQPFPILYLPVVNSENEPIGAVKFNNLIKGEA
jgi:pentose-5-phosphate-3-epimerase/CBS domain-containing protein